jgi:outer membrane murein-binding lipoprotein Lpp
MIRFGALVLAVSLLAGCGGGAEVKTTTTTVSVGQQLIDLKKARDSGSMTQSEYDKAKKQLIDRVLD